MKNRLYCFSPPIMLATFLIEFSLAGFIMRRYKSTVEAKIITALLLCLGVFQLSEFFLCGGLWLDGRLWGTIGYCAITMLPPLGLHLAQQIRRDENSLPTYLGYLMSFGWVVAFITDFVVSHGFECRPNYAVFIFSQSTTTLYSFYYFSLLFLAMSLCFVSVKKIDTQRRRTLKSLLIGYLVFLVPTALIALYFSETIAGIPSIMCGFAVLLAFILAFSVAPKVCVRR